jgi:hypothetical protein
MEREEEERICLLLIRLLSRRLKATPIFRDGKNSKSHRARIAELQFLQQRSNFPIMTAATGC